MTTRVHGYVHAGSGQGGFPWSEIFVQAWESVCTYRTCACARFVTALSICEGAVTGRAPRFAAILPGLHSPLAGECPLHARAIVILVQPARRAALLASRRLS